MSHWAELDENNVVIRVTVGDNNDPNGDEGYQWLIDNLGGTWVQTSINNNFRKKFAGEGDTYDEELDGFIPPKPFESWTFNSESWTWEPPVPQPEDYNFMKINYGWKESTQEWVVKPDSGFLVWDKISEQWID
jgi:hypothetical protein